MIRRASLLLLAVGLLASGACKKEESEPQTVPLPSAAPPATQVAADPVPPADTAAPGGTASAAAPADTPPADTAAVAPTAPQGGPAKGSGPSIDACCSALAKMAVLSGKSQESKNRAGTAGQLCRGLAQKVKDGQVTKATAMATIKGTLRDVSAPPECH